MPSTTPNFDRISPQYCVNAKLRRLHRVLNSAYENKFRSYGLQGSMLSILFIIGKRKHINQKSVAEMLVLDKSTMSRDVKKLIGRGWVQAFKGEDPRNTALELTPEGYALLEEIAPIWETLQTSVEAILGKYLLLQVDALTNAIKTNITEISAQ